MTELTAEEKAYFESGGTTLPGAQGKPAEPVQPVPAETEVPAEPVASEPVQDAPEGQSEASPQKQDFVPQQALHKERERRKAAEAAARERELELARLQERVKAFEKPAEAAKPAPPPDPDEDVFAAVKHDRTQLQSIQEKLAEIEKQEQARAHMASIEAMTRIAEQKFREATPDYDDAVAHLKTNRVQELMLWGLSQHQAQMQVQQEAAEIVAHAVRSQKSPAEVAYEMARMRGYQPKAASQSPDDKKERAREVSKSLSGTGSSPAGTMTAERLMKMSEKEFADYYSKNPSAVEKLMGA